MGAARAGAGLFLPAPGCGGGAFRFPPARLPRFVRAPFSGGAPQTPPCLRRLFLLTANAGNCFGGDLKPTPHPLGVPHPPGTGTSPTRVLQLPGWHQPPPPAAQPDFSHAKPRLKLLSRDCVYL